MNDLPIYLNTAQIAALLGLSARTLDRHRINGSGPPFYSSVSACVTHSRTCRPGRGPVAGFPLPTTATRNG